MRFGTAAVTAVATGMAWGVDPSIEAVGGVAAHAVVITAVATAARASASRVARRPRVRLPNLISVSLAVVVMLPDRRPQDPGTITESCVRKMEKFLLSTRSLLRLL